MTTTLTERYISETIRSLAPAAQADVRAELEASIGDAIEARVDEGEDRADAERAVLTDLGDPGALSAGYADRPLHLIGPRYYLAWRRLLKLLLIIVPVSVAGVVMLGQALAGAPLGDVIGQPLGIGVTVAVHIAFWVTLIFTLLERSDAASADLAEWAVDQLPEPQAKGASKGDTVSSLVMLVIWAGALLWDRFRGFTSFDGEPLSIVNPQLWPWWMTGFFVLMVAEGVLAIAVYRHRRWTTAFAVINTALAACFMSFFLTLLARGELFGQDFVDFALVANGVDAETIRILAVLTAFTAAGIAVWDVVDGWCKAARANRGARGNRL